MLTLFWFAFWVGLAVLTFAAGISLRARLGERLGSPGMMVDDDAVRAILETGTLHVDDPLDLDEIEEEERRFWSERWDEPDEL